jgi:hypothetical protein
MKVSAKQINLFKTKLTNGNITEKQKSFFMKKIEEFEKQNQKKTCEIGTQTENNFTFEIGIQTVETMCEVCDEELEYKRKIQEQIENEQVVEEVVAEFVINPDTNKKVKVGGRLYKKLKRENKL